MAKTIARLERELKRLAEKLETAHGEAKGDEDRARPEGHP